MWNGIKRVRGFWSELPWLEDGEALWQSIKDRQPVVQPTVLTGKATYGLSQMLLTHLLTLGNGTFKGSF